jgi:hypothetical protein
MNFSRKINEIDWTSSIDGAAALKEMLLEGTEAEQEFATRMLLLDAAIYSTKAQLNEVYTKNREEIAKLGEDGKITATEMA